MGRVFQTHIILRWSFSCRLRDRFNNLKDKR